MLLQQLADAPLCSTVRINVAALTSAALLISCLHDAAPALEGGWVTAAGTSSCSSTNANWHQSVAHLLADCSGLPAAPLTADIHAAAHMLLAILAFVPSVLRAFLLPAHFP